ncbi:MAG: restriction endonuclease [Pseudomonadota bacterium]
MRGQKISTRLFNVAALTLLVPLGACIDPETMTFKAPQGTGLTTAGAASSQALATAPAAVDPLLVRAPEVFQVSALTVWDGNRTSRGVWVAHPDVRAPMQVRIVNPNTKLEIDGIVYRQHGSDAGDVLTVSSDAASALGIVPGKSQRINLFALRAAKRASKQQRNTAASQAQIELASYISRMDQNDLLQLVAAAMRGMGYATIFASVTQVQSEPAIKAFPRPDGGMNLPSIRVSVRPGQAQPMSADDVLAVQSGLQGTGDIGVIVSAAGFSKNAERVLGKGGVHIELVDLEGLLNIWLTHYERLSEPDRALLRLQPVYFLADG